MKVGGVPNNAAADLPRNRQRISHRHSAAMGSPSLASQGPDESPASTAEDRAVKAARRREKRRQRNERAEWWSTKLHALLWVIASAVAIYLSDIPNVCLKSENVNRFSLDLGMVLFGLVILAVIRMAMWFPKGEDEASYVDFDKAHPIFTLGTTFGGVLSFFFLTIGLWPVYRIFAPFLLILIWFGMIMSLHFVP